jgi:DNA-directed RNA polymerase subunit RPC12/RpoP
MWRKFMTVRKSEKILYNEKLKPFYEINGKEYICKKCGNNLKANREKHYNACEGILYKEEYSVVINDIKYSKTCQFGCGKESLFFYKNGKSYCSKLGNSCPVKKKNDSQLKTGNKTYSNTFNGKTPWNKGLTKENSPKVKEMGLAISNSFVLNGDQRLNKNHTEQSKNKLREKINARYASGWQATSCGRAKSYPYNNPSEGIVHLTGTWEVALATALDKANIKWLRNKKRFDYIKPNGEAATYLPDFYIPEWHTYFEVKGYRTELDNAKWAQFKEPLIILYKKEIFQIKKWLNESIDITEAMLTKLFEDQYNLIES